MLSNKTCLFTLNEVKHFLKATNWNNHGLAQRIRLVAEQNVKTISCSTLNSRENLSQFQNNLKQGQKGKLLPVSKVLVQYRMGSSSADHVRLWQIERITSAALPVLLPASLILESSIIDSLLAALVVIHTHWGLEALIVDYARPIILGSFIPKILHLLLNILSAVTLAGLLVLIYNGPGIGKTVKNVWNIGKEAPTNNK